MSIVVIDIGRRHAHRLRGRVVRACRDPGRFVRRTVARDRAGVEQTESFPVVDKTYARAQLFWSGALARLF